MVCIYDIFVFDLSDFLVGMAFLTGEPLVNYIGIAVALMSVIQIRRRCGLALQ